MSDIDDRFSSILSEKFGLTAGESRKLLTHITPLAADWISAQKDPKARPLAALRAEFERQIADPPKFAVREDQFQTPIAFYDKHWRRFADAGFLYQKQLRHLDEALIGAITSYCQQRKLPARNHLPPPGYKEADNILATADPNSPEYKLAQRRASERLRKRKQRTKPHPIL